MRSLLILIILIATNTSVFAQDDFDIKKEYDKFSKTTTILLDEKLIVKGTNTNYNLISYVRVNYSDKDTTYYWGFSKFTERVTEIATINDKVSLLIDDELVNLEPKKVHSSVGSISYVFLFPKELLLKTVNAINVDMQIINSEFKYEGRFKKEDLDILKSFLKKY